MKKLYILIAIIAVAFNANAQGWAKSITPGAATNVYHNFTFDNSNNPVVIGGAAEISGGGQPLVFMKFDKQTGSRTLLKRYNGRTNAESYKLHTDAQGNTYFFGTFMDYIAFGNDTVYTYDRMYWNRANFILIKFDKDGNRIWSKKFGQKFLTQLNNIVDAHFTENAFHVVISYASDSVFHDNTFLEKLPSTSVNSGNYCFSKINLSDGSLHTFKRLEGHANSDVKLFAVKENNTYEFGTMLSDGNRKFVVYSFTDNTNLTVKCSTVITAYNTSTGHDLEQGVWLNGHYYLLAVNTSGGGASIYNGDTVMTLDSPHNLRTGILMKFDSTFELKGHVRFHWINTYPRLWLSKNKLVVATRFSNTMYIENDSITCNNNQHGWILMGFNEDLTLKDTAQLNTANSTGGTFRVVCAGYDGSGNLYGQIVHNKNILFNGTTVQAALKSWDHLTVLFRKGDNLGTGLKEDRSSIQVSVFPNPSDNFITINAVVESASVFDITGKELLRSNSSQINVSELKQGVYFIRATTGTEQFHARFIRN